MADLSLSDMMAMSESEFEDVLNNRDALKQIGVDSRHVHVVLFHMLRKNLTAIDKFSRTSEQTSKVLNRLTCVIVVLMLLQILAAIINYLL